MPNERRVAVEVEEESGPCEAAGTPVALDLQDKGEAVFVEEDGWRRGGGVRMDIGVRVVLSRYRVGVDVELLYHSEGKGRLQRLSATCSRYGYDNRGPSLSPSPGEARRGDHCHLPVAMLPVITANVKQCRHHHPHSRHHWRGH